MTIIDLEDFTRKVYAKSIYTTLKSIVESQDLKGPFGDMDYKTQKEFEEKLRNMADKISYKFIDLLKKKGFPEIEISDAEQNELLKEVINEFLSKEITSSN